MADTTKIPADLHDWLAEVTGATSIAVERVPGGASREAWFVEAECAAGVRPLFLRYDRRPPRPGSAFHTLQVEAEILTALHRHGIAVPEVVAVHPVQQAVLLERVDGATWFRLIADEDEQVRVARDFIGKLAAMHRLDPRALDIASLGPVRTVRDHVRAEIAAMRARVARRTIPSPLLTFCLDRLERDIPEYDGPPVLVQGDTGPGNFLYENGAVTAIVDMELAHYGDPMDDIAWLSLRTVQDTFTHFPSRLAEYAQLTGNRIDEDRVWYYRLLAETRLATQHTVSVEARVRPAVGTPDPGNLMIYSMLHRRLLVEALARVTGVKLESAALDREFPESPYASGYQATLDVLRQSAGRSRDPLATLWTKGAARIIKYLQEVDRCGAVLDTEECSELGRLLGTEPESPDEGRVALGHLLERGELDEAGYIAQIWRGLQRDDYLMRTASGALYHRTWPELK